MQSNKVASWQEKTYDIFKQFITASHLPQQIEAQQRVQALLSLLLISSLLASFLTIIRYLAGESIFIETIWTILSFTFYLLIRQGFYTPILFLMIIGSAFFAPFVYFVSPENYYDTLGLYAAFASILLAILFTNRRTIPHIIAVNWGVVLFLVMQFPDLSFVARLSQFIPFAFGSISLVLAAIIIEHNFKQLNQQNYKLNKQQQQFHYLFDTFPKPIIIHVNDKIIYSNTFAERLLQKRDLSNCSISDFIRHDDMQNSQFNNQYGSMIVSYDTKLRFANEESIPINVTTQVVSYEKHLATLMLLQPTTLETEDNTLLETIVTTFNKPLVVLDVAVDAISKISFVNPAFSKMLGYQENELLNHSPAIFNNSVNGYGSILDELELALKTGEESLSIEAVQCRKDGINLLTVWDTQIIYDEHGNGQYCIASVTNLSEKGEQEFDQHVIQQAVVSELGLLSLSIDSHLQLLEHAVIMCEQVLDIDNCAIFEYQHHAQNLKCVAISHSTDECQTEQVFSLDSTSSQIAFALEKNEAVGTPNFQNENRFEKFPQFNGQLTQSALSVVIPGREQAYGILTIFSCEIKLNIEDDLYFLQAIANILGSFAESSQAHQAEREQQEFAEALQNATAIINTRLELPEMLDKLMGYVLQVVPQVESGSIMLWDVTEQSYRFIYTWGFNQEADNVVTERSFAAEEFPLMQKMMGDHRPMILSNVDEEPLWIRTNDFEHIHSYLGAPIIVQGDCIGFFHLNSTVLNAFSQHDAIRLQTFADKVGTAISNARYAHELEDLVKERTEELQRERERFSSILEASGDGIFYNENRRIAFVNSSLTEMMGYTAQEMVGQYSTMFRPDVLSEEELEKFESISKRIRANEICREKLRFQRKDGSILEVGITASPVGLAVDGIVRTVTIVRDISQEKALDNAKSRFIANAAHELRSPITSLKTRMYMIDKQPDRGDYHLSRLDQIVGRMNRLVSDLLDMAYFEHGQVTLRPESIIVQDVVERIVGILDAEAELEKLKLIHDSPEKPIHIWADVHRIEQVLTNLIANAIHYTPQGGQVKVLCSVDNDNQQAIICVEDTGEGIPPEHLENIFEAFYRLDNNMEKKGTGLGLSITREIVKLHQGTIAVESTLGEGTSFIITLPLLDE